MEDNNINFYQGTTNVIKLDNNKDPLEQIKERIAEFFNMRNVHFLFGSGISCNAIPNMHGLYDVVKEKNDNPNSK